jgi:hypothetical protein
MELLVFAIVAARNGYQMEETLVADLTKFRPFDLRAIRVDSKRRSTDQESRLIAKRSLVTQVRHTWEGIRVYIHETKPILPSTRKVFWRTQLDIPSEATPTRDINRALSAHELAYLGWLTETDRDLRRCRGKDFLFVVEGPTFSVIPNDRHIRSRIRLDWQHNKPPPWCDAYAF